MSIHHTNESCDLIGQGGSWFMVYKAKFYDCTGGKCTLKFQQHLLNDISIKQIHWLDSLFERTLEAQLVSLYWLWVTEKIIHTLWTSPEAVYMLHCLLSEQWIWSYLSLSSVLHPGQNGWGNCLSKTWRKKRNRWHTMQENKTSLNFQD